METAEALLRGLAVGVTLAVEAGARRTGGSTPAPQAMPGGGTARVTIAGDAAMRHVTVADEGPGIRREDAPRLFEPLYTTKPKGTGLGLAIGRRIAEAHGGTLTVEPHGGPGARLRLALPRAGRVREGP